MEYSSPHVEFMTYDFADVTNSHEVLDKTIQLFGQLDYLVLIHASIVTGPFLHFKRHQNPEFIDRAFRINVFSYIQIALKALPHLEQTKGHIFVTSSISGEVGNGHIAISILQFDKTSCS